MSSQHVPSDPKPIRRLGIAHFVYKVQQKQKNILFKKEISINKALIYKPRLIHSISLITEVGL